MPAKLWDFDPAAHDIADKTFIKCQGEVVEYDNNLEIQIQAYELICKVEDYLDRVPASWREHGGVFIPMYQREALWLN